MPAVTSPLDRFEGPSGALRLASFLAAFVGGLVAFLLGLSLLATPSLLVRGLVLIGLASLTFLACRFTWTGDPEAGGLVATAASVGLLLVPSSMAGLLVLAGGIAALVSPGFGGPERSGGRRSA